MPGDHYRKAQAGEPLMIGANVWNDLIDMLRWWQGQEQSLDFGDGRRVVQTTEIKVKNASGSDRERFEILTLTGPSVTPTDNLDEFKSVLAQLGDTPAAASDPFCVLLEPVPDGEFGRAVVSGVTVCKINVTDAGHDYANPTPTDPTVLTSGASGESRILWKEAGTGSSLWALVRLGDGSGGASGSLELIEHTTHSPTSGTTDITSISNPDVIYVNPTLNCLDLFRITASPTRAYLHAREASKTQAGIVGIVAANQELGRGSKVIKEGRLRIEEQFAASFPAHELGGGTTPVDVDDAATWEYEPTHATQGIRQLHMNMTKARCLFNGTDGSGNPVNCFFSVQGSTGQVFEGIYTTFTAQDGATVSVAGGLIYQKVGGGGGVVTSLNTLSGAQVFADVDDTNVTLAISSAGSTHTFTMGWTGQLSIARGGTGQSTQTAAFDALAPCTTKGDLIAYNGADNVRVAVGANGIALIGNSVAAAGVSFGTVVVAGGGTGATDAAGARTNLGLVIGTDVQAWDADLDTLAAAGLPVSVANGGTGATDATGARTNLGLGTLAVENDPLSGAKGGTGADLSAGTGLLKMTTGTGSVVNGATYTLTYSNASTTHAALTSDTLIDSTNGTPSTTINDVGSSFSQSTLNDNNASLLDQINKLRADLTNAKQVLNQVINDFQAAGFMT